VCVDDVINFLVHLVVLGRSRRLVHGTGGVVRQSIPLLGDISSSTRSQRANRRRQIPHPSADVPSAW
jgi:hypothetical protein